MATIRTGHSATVPVNGERQREPSARFDPKKTYVIGQLTKGADVLFPEDSWRRVPKEVPGRFFTKEGIRTIDGYFERNPHGLPLDQSFVIYERTPDGNLKFVKSGSFLSASHGSLADGERPFPAGYYQGVQTPQTAGASEARALSGLKDMMELQTQQLREVLDRQQEIVGQLIAQNQQILDRYQGMSDAHAEMKAAAEVERTRAEHEKFLAQFREDHRKQVEDECAAYYKDLEKQRPTGLSDPAVLTAILSNAPSIINMLKDLFAPKEQTPAPAPAAVASTEPLDPAKLAGARNGASQPSQGFAPTVEI